VLVPKLNSIAIVLEDQRDTKKYATTNFNFKLPLKLLLKSCVKEHGFILFFLTVSDMFQSLYPESLKKVRTIKLILSTLSDKLEEGNEMKQRF
jgi:hypothetical protein